MLHIYTRLLITITFAFAGMQNLLAQATAEQEIIQMLQHEQPFHSVTPDQFGRLGWDLPDAGTTVKALADAAPGYAFDPRDLEQLPVEKLGYQAKWHEVRYQVYGLDWDITGLHLVPNDPLPGMPTMVLIHGGASTWYHFYVDALNQSGIAQYLAQKIPVMLITIPGNYRHGGWTEKDLERRIPGYVLDRDVAEDELKIRNSVYTFRVISDGVKKLLETTTSGPLIIVGHSTGGEIQFLLHESSLKERTRGLSLGWGTGGPAGLDVMKGFRTDSSRNAEDYPDVWELTARPASGYAGEYLGPLNPVWDTTKTRMEMAEHWMGREARRKPKFKQVLQNVEHQSSDHLREHFETQIRSALAGNEFDVNADEVVADLFSTMRSPHTGYRKMVWTTAPLDEGHWDADLSKARELLIADEFREKNPGAPIRVMLFDVPMTHNGHIEKPRELAGGLLAALKWLVMP